MPNDADRLEHAYRHCDPAARRVDARSPLEEVMEREEYEPGRREPLSLLLAPLFQDLLSFLLADGDPTNPALVERRATILFRHLLPGMALERRQAKVRVEDFTGASVGVFPLREFRALLEGQEDWEEGLGLLMNYLFPAQGTHWLREGARRTYVLARAYAQMLVSYRPVMSADGGVSRDRKRQFEAWEMTFEQMGRAFGERMETEEQRARARSRWSARAQRLVTRPVEENGGVAALQFGKSAEAREHYRAAAKGNTNRRSGRGKSDQ